MLSCRDESRGFIEYYCEHCNETRTIYFGCNSRICSRCGKVHSDNWADTVSKSMFKVPHRHVVLSMPDRLWPIFQEDRCLLKVLMDSVIESLNNVLTYALHKDVKVGAIVVLHPFSRDISWKPHVHILMTEGGFDRRGRFNPKVMIPYVSMRKVWQYTLLTNLKKALPSCYANARFIDRLFKDYPQGFYAHLPPESRITSTKKVSKYVGRYVRHPAIANYRLYGYDGKSVSFWYKDNADNVHYRTMAVFDFIHAIIQHIPDPQFKMIRHYGAYSRNQKKKYRRYLPQRSIALEKFDEFPKKYRNICPNCGSLMRVISYRKKGPPKELVFGEKLSDWCGILVNRDSL